MNIQNVPSSRLCSWLYNRLYIRLQSVNGLFERSNGRTHRMYCGGARPRAATRGGTARRLASCRRQRARCGAKMTQRHDAACRNAPRCDRTLSEIAVRACCEFDGDIRIEGRAACVVPSLSIVGIETSARKRRGCWSGQCPRPTNVRSAAQPAPPAMTRSIPGSLADRRSVIATSTADHERTTAAPPCLEIRSQNVLFSGADLRSGHLRSGRYEAAAQRPPWAPDKVNEIVL